MDIKEKVKQVVAGLGHATADEVARQLEKQEPQNPDKQIIAAAHAALTQLYQSGEIKGTEKDGELIYSAA